jgi:hypothetical protein
MRKSRIGFTGNFGKTEQVSFWVHAMSGCGRARSVRIRVHRKRIKRLVSVLM